MSSDTTVIYEQPLPFCIRLISRVTTFTGFVESLLSILILWLCPSLAPTTPTFRSLPKQHKHDCRVRASSLSSIASTTSTLVNSNEPTEEIEEVIEQKVEVTEQLSTKQRRLTFPFTKLSVQTPLHTPHILQTPNISIRPLVRRMSTTGKQFANTIHTPFMHTAPEWSAASYFSPRHHVEGSIGPLEVEKIEATEEICVVEASITKAVEEDVVETVEEQVQISSGQKVKKVTKVKRVSHKVKSLLHFVHRSKRIAI